MAYTLKGLLAELVANLGTPAGASTAADIAAIKLVVDAISTASITEIADILADTSILGTFVNSGGTATLAAMLGDFANTSLVTKLAAISSKIDTVDDFIDTEITAIKAVTDAISGKVYKQFVATVNTTGSIPLFTVDGCVKVKITAICFAGLTSDDVGTITLKIGTTTIIPTTTATDLITGEVWFDATPTTKVDTVANGELNYIIGDASDITLEIANTVDSGSIGFKVEWEVLVAGGSVVAA